ncbi:MAG: hypothetical protein GEV12_08545 [Micromonosporaceae bacterium]|nr:hypothetical protein [Micromonosporaceae bacterium]
MGTDMIIRTLYVIAGTEPDFAAGKAAAARLVAGAEPAELDVVLDEGWAADIEPTTHRRNGEPTHHLPTDQARQLIAHTLDELLEGAARTCTSREVDRYHLGSGQSPGVEMYATGGPNGAESSFAFTAWDILVEDHRLPAGWSATINNAIGLVDPAGNGRVAATVTFRTWS